MALHGSAILNAAGTAIVLFESAQALQSRDTVLRGNDQDVDAVDPKTSLFTPFAGTLNEATLMDGRVVSDTLEERGAFMQPKDTKFGQLRQVR